MEINIKYKLLLNGRKLLKVLKLKNKLYFITDDENKLKRSDIDSIISICDNCESETILKNIPENYILSKDNYFCKSCRNVGKNNPMYGKKWTDKLKKERSLKYSGENNPMYGKSLYGVWVEKYGEEIAKLKKNEYANKHSKLNSGENNPMYGKTYYDIWVEKYGEKEAFLRNEYKKSKNKKWLEDNPDQLKKMIIQSHKKRYRKTSIERKLENYLINQKIDYKYNFILDNKYQFDFLIKDRNLIIEVNGDYWHANPEIYSDSDENKKPLNDTQRYKVDLDEKKNKYLISKGYEVIYLWEKEINNDIFKKILKKWNL